MDGMGSGGRFSCRAGAGAWCALLLLLAPAPASAVCGDHVRLGNEPLAPAPCDGPACSRDDRAPVPAPVPAPASIADHALLPAPVEPSGDGRASRLPAFSSAYECLSLLRVFHPPRAG